MYKNKKTVFIGSYTESFTNSSIELLENNKNDKQNIKHLYIFDYDDTLLSTSALISSNIYLNTLLSTKAKNNLFIYELKLLEMLNYIHKKTNIIIITNADKEWVYESSKKFLNNLYLWLIKNDIEINSARPKTDIKNNKNQKLWKNEVFRNVLENFILNNTIYNNYIIYGTGDKLHDREALIKNVILLNKKYNKQDRNIYYKSIKMLEKPKLRQLCNQIKLIKEMYVNEYNNLTNNDLMMSIDFL